LFAVTLAEDEETLIETIFLSQVAGIFMVKAKYEMGVRQFIKEKFHGKIIFLFNHYGDGRLAPMKLINVVHVGPTEY
jgi:hypothetical protein